MVIFSRTGYALVLSEIEQLENYVKLNFPEIYKKHLLTYNGGRCTPNIFSFIEFE